MASRAGEPVLTFDMQVSDENPLSTRLLLLPTKRKALTVPWFHSAPSRNCSMLYMILRLTTSVPADDVSGRRYYEFSMQKYSFPVVAMNQENLSPLCGSVCLIPTC